MQSFGFNTSVLCFTVTHYMLCMVGNAVFILHSIMQAFVLKHPSKFCTSKRSAADIGPKDDNGDIHDLKSVEYDKNTVNNTKTGKLNRIRGCCSCSIISIMDAASFLTCLVLNLTGYCMLVKTYPDRIRG